MSMKAWQKIDRFFPILAVVLAIMAVLLIFTFRSIFSTLTTAHEVDLKIPDSELRIDKDRLNEAHKVVYEKEIVPLEIR